MNAESAGPGEGTTVTARLPIAQHASPKPAQAAGPASKASVKRVLVVDDNPDIRDSLRMLLVMWGHEVDVASSGEEALALALSIRPDIALVDIGLPGMDGYQVAKAIRQASADWRTKIKLVAVTGYGQPSDRQQALDSGFDGHMLKPVDTDLLEKIFTG